MNDEDIAIISAKRTAIGSYLGSLSSIHAPHLAAFTLAANLKEANLKPEEIDAVILGCVLSAGLGQAPARQAALKAGLAHNVACTTVNKICGSSLQAIMMAYDSLCANSYTIMMAGGMESMSRAPYLCDKARIGYRIGHGRLLDHMIFDGLEDAYEPGQLMGMFAERCVKKYTFTREQQDKFALSSLERANLATKEGFFKQEIVSISVIDKKENKIVEVDEAPTHVNPDKIPSLKAAFNPDGTITAASSSSLADGAASVLLMKVKEAQKRNLKVRAIIKGHTSFAQTPEWFTTAPVQAIKNLLNKLSWSINDVDLFEINEAFAVVTLTAMQELAIPHEKVNVHGGACALGHPIGASGARLVTTLLHALERLNLKKGIACLCIGGGEAVALAIEIQ